ncbi:hypothetical protein F53441_12755 [Fusarium austroafricanum]|uniref:Uncharacterized protein n=1 Tax=Fusarium austroafricanum TaxID=2364996 RepID=A0A8H4JTF1_9HYPO|nr:hypothetical protein F53441_12755 [Fusarium austroafricanum]
MGPPKQPRGHAKQVSAFVFVDTSSTTFAGIVSQDDKINIRRQAARSGNKRHKRRRPESTTQEDESDSQIRLAVLEKRAYTLRPRLSSKGYESLRATYNFDILDLASFADVDLATNAHQLVQNEPNWYKDILRQSASSFLVHLPSRYGQDPCLDDTMRCVAARASQMVGMPMKPCIPDLLYGKALESLQKEIGKPSFTPTVNSYGATRLLVLYELLGQPHKNRLVTHLRGSVQLLGLRKAAQYESEFDRALLKSQGPSIVVDELYRMRSSMFEDAEWQRLLQHASVLETDHESSFWWKFLGVVAFLPGILKDMRLLFDVEGYQSGSTGQSAKILERATMVYRKLHEHNILYQRKPPHPSSLFNLPTSTESPDRIRLREFFLYTMIFICRIKATLSPDDWDRALNEEEAQNAANQALLIEKVTKQFDKTMAWHFEQRNSLAKSVTETRVEWLADLVSDGDLHKLLAQRWLKWENSWRNSVLDVEYGE